MMAAGHVTLARPVAWSLPATSHGSLDPACPAGARTRDDDGSVRQDDEIRAPGRRILAARAARRTRSGWRRVSA